MIINSQFFITYYGGKQPLSLKIEPTGLTSTQRADYQKFIQSIGSIYASQSPNGKIPKFWTTLTETTDALGGTQFVYVPHPDSDLEYLSPKNSYYFIVRDEAAIPLRVPSVGGNSLGFADAGVLPRVLPSSIKNISLTTSSGNSAMLNPVIDNLQPYEEYFYQFKGVDANWPVDISPLSGIIKPSTTDSTINAKVSFCLSSGNCASNITYHLEDVPPQLKPLAEQTNKYAIINLSVTPVSYTGPEILSDQFTILCKDCLPKPSEPTTEIVSLSGLTLSVNNKFPIQYLFDNLKPHKTYNYNIETLNSNWPFYVSSISGLITSSGVKDVVETFGVFCTTTGECPSCEKGVLPYTISTGCLGCSSIDWAVPQTSFRLALQDPDYPTTIHYSNILTLNCSNCNNSYVSVSVQANDLRNC